MLLTEEKKNIAFSVLLLENFTADHTSCSLLETFPDSAIFIVIEDLVFNMYFE